MNNLLAISFACTLIFFLIKFFEMRFIKKESTAFKILFFDSIIVFLSCLIGLYIISQVGNLGKLGSFVGGGDSTKPKVFTGDAKF